MFKLFHSAQNRHMHLRLDHACCGCCARAPAVQSPVARPPAGRSGPSPGRAATASSVVTARTSYNAFHAGSTPSVVSALRTRPVEVLRRGARGGRGAGFAGPEAGGRLPGRDKQLLELRVGGVEAAGDHLEAMQHLFAETSVAWRVFHVRNSARARVAKWQVLCQTGLNHPGLVFPHTTLAILHLNNQAA